MSKKIYLAGKIGMNGWRHDIVEGLRGALRSYDEFKFPILENAIFGQFDYVGPYFISCDHGCYHGPSTHGMGRKRSIDTNHAQNCRDSYIDPEKIVIECKKAIERCDIFFIWIDSLNAYGSFYELGYANALGKEIYYAGKHPFEEKKSYDRINKTYITTEIIKNKKFENIQKELWFLQASVAVNGNTWYYSDQSNNPKIVLKKCLKEKDYLEKKTKHTYFIKNGQFVKIGHSKDPKGRLSQLQTANHKDLTLIHTTSIPEKDLHKEFDKYHSEGEWFFYSKEIKEFIKKDKKRLGV